ncbi:MAG: NAD(P)H-dependent glycerol-3-phosphate dehydrogenase [Candidatus Magasanikbacteria bacterium]
MNICILGAGNFGTTIANTIAKNGYEVSLWNWDGDSEPIKQIQSNQENEKYLPGIKLSDNITATLNMKQAIDGADMVCFIVASSAIKNVVEQAGQYITSEQLLVNFTKGIDSESLKLTTETIKELDKSNKENIATLAGPAVANQLSKEQFTAMNIASENSTTIEKIKEVLQNDYLKLNETRDMVGVQVGSAFKNVYAIALGICDGMDLPLNTKSALLTIAIEEIAELAENMGGEKETMFDLAGIGDLIGTALADSSRNRRFGEYLAQGKTVPEAKQTVGQTVEGIEAVKVFCELADKFDIPCKFANLVKGCIEAGTCNFDKEHLFNLFNE